MNIAPVAYWEDEAYTKKSDQCRCM